MMFGILFFVNLKYIDGENNLSVFFFKLRYIYFKYYL